MSDMANYDEIDNDVTADGLAPPISAAFKEFFEEIDTAVSEMFTPMEIEARLAQLYANNPRPIRHGDLEVSQPVPVHPSGPISFQAGFPADEIPLSVSGSMDALEMRIIKVHSMADEASRTLENLETQAAMAFIEASQERARLEEATNTAISRAEKMVSMAEDVILDGQVNLAETSSAAINETHRLLIRAEEILRYAELIHANCKAERDRMIRETRQILADTRSMWRLVQDESVASRLSSRACGLPCIGPELLEPFDFFHSRVKAEEGASVTTSVPDTDLGDGTHETRDFPVSDRPFPHSSSPDGGSDDASGHAAAMVANRVRWDVPVPRAEPSPAKPENLISGDRDGRPFDDYTAGRSLQGKYLTGSLFSLATIILVSCPTIVLIGVLVLGIQDLRHPWIWGISLVPVFLVSWMVRRHSDVHNWIRRNVANILSSRREASVVSR